MNNNENMCLDWNDSIETDGQEFVLLPEGDYNFTITNFERGRFTGGPKIPACNKTSITAQVQTKDGIASVKFDLLLYRSVEWKISAFFRCIGQKKAGEKLTMDWNKVIGSVGRAHFKPRNYTDANGNKKQANDLEKFIDYKPAYFTQSNTKSIEVNDDDLPF